MGRQMAVRYGHRRGWGESETDAERSKRGGWSGAREWRAPEQGGRAPLRAGSRWRRAAQERERGEKRGEKREGRGRVEKQRGMGHLYTREECSGGRRAAMPARAG
jgi:hypothetical protein